MHFNGHTVGNYCVQVLVFLQLQFISNCTLEIRLLLALVPCYNRFCATLISVICITYSLHSRHSNSTCNMAGWAECIDTARYQFELGNYEMALEAYKACIADLNKVIRNSTDNALRNKAIEVSVFKVHGSCKGLPTSARAIAGSLYFGCYCTLRLTVFPPSSLILLLRLLLLYPSDYSTSSSPLLKQRLILLP